MKKEQPIRILLNTKTRDLMEVYEISPDGREYRTQKGWVSAYKKEFVIMKSDPGKEFISGEQIAFMKDFRRDVLQDRKNIDKGQYLVAKKFPVEKWLSL